MTGVTYNTNVSTGIILFGPNENPVTINTGVTITNTGTAESGDAIFGAFNAFTVVNLGTVSATAPRGVAVLLAGGGIVINGSAGGSAVVSSNFTGVEIAGNLARWPITTRSSAPAVRPSCSPMAAS